MFTVGVDKSTSKTSEFSAAAVVIIPVYCCVLLPSATNPKLPKEGSLDGVLSRNPDPPAMNAGMPRDPAMLDRLKALKMREELMQMGPRKVQQLLGLDHEGDYRHLFDESNPNAFRHGIQDAGRDEIAQLARELEIAKAVEQHEKMDAQRRMAWTAMIAMLVFTALVFLPLFPDTRIKALGDLFSLFYIGMAGCVSAYFGAAAFVSKKK